MPAIDRTRFEELRQMSGADFINELIDAFLDESPVMIQNIQVALAGKDLESFRRNAHSLKSNANTFGASELGALAQELEWMARDNNLDVGDRLEVLKEALESAVKELEEMRT